MIFLQAVPEPVTFSPFGQAAPYVYIVVSVLAFCSSLIAAIMVHRTESVRLKAQVESDTVRLKAQAERDTYHAGVIDKLYTTLQDHHGLYSALQQQMIDHCVADADFHREGLARHDILREDIEDIRIALGVRKGGYRASTASSQSGAPSSASPGPPGGPV